ncbi:cyclophilin-like family protein [Candidatus Nitrosocosmicus hydrocola]|uniref:cyclophilin-like family protein n=1 Tax=Candidatus Nitrosocosmicus hydrocola TaxID=1826872 RepID=UPI0011E5DB87|nr:cyclophilin-like family protein [Candidatus Nitrosocosmicus hydrocola]
MSIGGASVSRIEIQLLINDRHVINAEFKRHFSPLTIKKLISIMPISGLISKYNEKFVYIKTDLDIGVEKPVNNFKKGNIAFSPSGNFISVFLKETSIAQKYNLLGIVTSDNLDLLSSVIVGDKLTFRKSEI